MIPELQCSLDPDRAASFGLPGFEVWESIDSTNDRARILAQRGTPRGWLVLAGEQRAGRGRRGSVWRSSAGEGVWMSLVLGLSDGIPQLPILIGIACAETLRARTGADVRIKWPNDLLIERRKLGGILVESGAGWVVAGIGINVRAAPSCDDLDGENGPVEPTSLAAYTSTRPDPRDLAGELASSVLRILDSEDRLHSGLRRFALLDALRDRPVETDVAGAGVARGIDEEGRLVLESPPGSRLSVGTGSVRFATTSELEDETCSSW